MNAFFIFFLLPFVMSEPVEKRAKVTKFRMEPDARPLYKGPVNSVTNGPADGNGTLVFSDGRYIEGTFRDGDLVSGTMFDAKEQPLKRGSFDEEFRLHGETCELLYPDGTPRHQGSFSHGTPDPETCNAIPWGRPPTVISNGRVYRVQEWYFNGAPFRATCGRNTIFLRINGTRFMAKRGDTSNSIVFVNRYGHSITLKGSISQSGHIISCINTNNNVAFCGLYINKITSYGTDETQLLVECTIGRLLCRAETLFPRPNSCMPDAMLNIVPLERKDIAPAPGQRQFYCGSCDAKGLPHGLGTLYNGSDNSVVYTGLFKDGKPMGRDEDEEAASAGPTDQSITCHICCDGKKNRIISTCGHTYCSECVTRVNNRCPDCRAEFTPSNVLPLFL